MSSPLIMIIRHGEKPTKKISGIHPSGRPSRNSLIVRGWQRAGALVPFFTNPTRPELTRPTWLIAANRDAEGADPDTRSLREKQTVSALAAGLNLALDLRFGKGMEAKAASQAKSHEGPVLICWEHEKIVDLANLIAPEPNIPKHWPSSRFDLIFLFRRHGSGYRFEQLPQLLLPGDLETILE